MNNFADSFKALERAKDTLETSEHDLKGGFTLAAVNRAYYAMFYCMSTLLFTENLYAKSHKGVLIKYEELFVKTERMPKQTSLWVRTAFNLRQEADYDFEAVVTEEEAQIILVNARNFYELTKNYFQIFIKTRSID